MGGVRPFWKKSIIKLHFFYGNLPNKGNVSRIDNRGTIVNFGNFDNIGNVGSFGNIDNICNIGNIGDIGNTGNIVYLRKDPEGCFEKIFGRFSRKFFFQKKF